MSLATETTKAPKVSRLEKSARTLLAKAEASLGADRLTNTRKRAEEAAHASRRAQKEILRAKVALAIVQNGGQLGHFKVASLHQIEELEHELSRTVSRVFGWVPDEKRTHHQDAEAVERDTNGRPEIAALALGGLAALVALRSSCDTFVEDPVRVLERKLVGFSAPGFFPTPKVVAAGMVDIAEKALGRSSLAGLHVLEPSAGSGRLADGARESGGKVHCVEINYTLAELLKAKGYEVSREDFESWSKRVAAHFHVVLANFPFESGTDAIHAQAAFGHLEFGGVMVFITGEGIWFRDDRVSRDFRDWIASLGDDVFHNEKLPAGTFNVSDVTQRTGAASRLVAIRRAVGS